MSDQDIRHADGGKHANKAADFATGEDNGQSPSSSWLYSNLSMLVQDTPSTLQHVQLSNQSEHDGPVIFNYSNQPLPGMNGSGNIPIGDDGSMSSYSLPEAIVIGTILSLIIFFAVAGNLLVVVGVLTDRKLRKPTNYFIISLAVADMLVGTLVMTFAVVNDIMGYWVFGEHFCSVWISFDIMCSTASILNLCAISLDRWVHIKNPFHYDQMMTPFRTCLWVAFVWALSLLISFLPINMGWHQIGMEMPELNPLDSPPKHFICLLELSPIFALVSSLVSFYLPCSAMLIIYLRLFLFARKQAAAIKATTRVPEHLRTKNKQKQGSDNKAAITLGCIMGTFLFCWVPFFTINLVAAFCPTCVPIVVFSVLTWLGYFNSTLNPIIYSIFNVEFREAFKRVLRTLQCFKNVHFKRDIKFSSIPQSHTNNSHVMSSINMDKNRNSHRHGRVKGTRHKGSKNNDVTSV